MKRIKGGDRRDGWYEITPEVALALLNEKNSKNRPLSEHAAKRYAEVMKARRWLRNGESLIFDAKGHVLDGQTRLRACVLADKPFVSYAVFGVDPNVFDTIDLGRAKTGADMAAIRGFDNYAIVGGIAKIAISSERQSDPGDIIVPTTKDRVWNWAIDDWLRKNRDEVDIAAREAGRYRGHFTGMVGVCPVGWIYMVGRRQSVKKADEFLHGLGTGESLSAGSPILALRKKLTESLRRGAGPRTGVKFSDRVKLLMLGKAWNAFRDGQRVTKIQITDERMALSLTPRRPTTIVRSGAGVESAASASM